MPIYEANYSFDGYWRGLHVTAMEQAMRSLREMQADHIDIEHLGATMYADAEGVVTDIVARYEAPSEGIVGWHGCRARLPIGGFVRVDDADATPASRAMERSKPLRTAPQPSALPMSIEVSQ